MVYQYTSKFSLPISVRFISQRKLKMTDLTTLLISSIIKLLTRHRQAGDDNKGNLEQGYIVWRTDQKKKSPECYKEGHTWVLS